MTYEEINEIAKGEEAGMRKNAGDQITTAFVHGFKYCERMQAQKKAEQLQAEYNAGYKRGCHDRERLAKEADNAYQRGLDDAWDMLKYICLGGRERLLKVFGTISITKIITDNTAAEAKAKIDAWGQKEQQGNEIKVGDEVIYHGEKTVILWVYGDYIKIMYSNGATNCTHPDSVTKTGRHFDQIAEVLKQMRGEV